MAPPIITVAHSRDLVNSHFDNSTFSDLQIKLSDRVVHVHRVVLCRGSEYFTSLLAGRFLESNAKQVELQEDDPEAMMVLLRYLYALPYTAVESADVGEALLHPHALVYVVAEKYQIPRLREEAYEKMYAMLHPSERSDYDYEDFPAALRTIFTGTMPTSDARTLMIQACIAELGKLREIDGFLSLLLTLPDLGMEIIRHVDLTGDWLCESGRSCLGLPICSNCAALNPCYEPEPFEQSFAQKYRGHDRWPCPTCGIHGSPACSDCGQAIVWSTRGPTRGFQALSL